MKKILIPVLFIILTALFCSSKISKEISKEERAIAWADSTYHTLSLEEKVGQLFMVAAYSNKNEAHVSELENLVKKYHIGGVIFFQGGPYRQARITNRLQKASKIPLFVGIDAEWGLAMRLDSTYIYPWNTSLGAIQDNRLLERLGQQMGAQAKRLGVHFMFAPVVDINTNPNNPVIGNRSFGETKENVAKKSVAVVKGMQSAGVYATAKHFPGHGDTSKDSHHTLPTVDFDRNRIEEVELYPYKELIKEGLASVMVAHLEVPALEKKKGVPTSLSHATITDLLKNELQFEGLIFTDALGMKGASNYKKPGEIDLAAFLAGNDILLFSDNVRLGSQEIIKAYQSGTISEERLAYSVKKILKYKYLVGLNNTPQIETSGLVKDLHQPSFDDLSFELYEQMLTLLKNDGNILPMTSSENIAYIPLENDGANEFLISMRRYGEVEKFSVNQIRNNPNVLKSFDKVIIGNHKVDNIWKKNAFSDTDIELIRLVANKYPTLLVSFAKPYTLEKLSNTTNLEGVLVAYQNNSHAFEAVANALFGYTKISGKLPVSVGSLFKVGDGIELNPQGNLGVSTPAAQGMQAEILQNIDIYAQKAINNHYTPSAVVLVLRNGKIVFNKAYGSITYDDKKKVESTMVYDLASLTKMLGTLPMVMKLYEDKQLRFEDQLGDLLPTFKNTDKANITVKELLTHQSGLIAWIPFYKNTLDFNNQPSAQFYRNGFTKGFSLQVCDNLFIQEDYKKQIIEEIKESTLRPKKYKYSDLNFILLQQIVESKYGKPLDQLLDTYFIKPMGLHRMTYNPLRKMDVSLVAPTEKDTYFRHTTIRGYVHDMGAAMLGGIAGHAGLFSDAYDIASMMQLFLDGGNFNGKQLLKKETIDTFNICYFCKTGNRRGAGFDKPNLESAGNTCGCTSPRSFGHTGFTGTMAWADPDKNLVYVFLSNRTYPNADKNYLSKENIREDIQQVIYDAIIP